MARIGELARKRYNDFIKEYKGASAVILEEDRRESAGLRKGDLSQTATRVKLANKALNLVSYYTLMNSLSLALLNIKNDAILNEARKACYKAIIHLEDVVSTCIDCPFSDYEAGVVAIDEVLGDKEKHDLVRKLGYSVASVKDGFGTNSKWKWSFVEIEGRFAVVVKNLINLKTLLARLDPSYRNYDAVLSHLDVAQRKLEKSALDYREKYELVTRRHDDMERAINFLSALRRIHVLLGESDKADALKRKVDVWRTKLNTDLKGKKTDQAAPRAREGQSGT
jgi:hypothetical protein